MDWTEARIRIPSQPFLNLVEVAAVAKAHPKTIRRWVREGRFPAPRQPGRWTAFSVGVWLAWQDFAGDMGAEDAVVSSHQETPVKGKKVESRGSTEGAQREHRGNIGPS